MKKHKSDTLMEMITLKRKKIFNKVCWITISSRSQEIETIEHDLFLCEWNVEV